MTQRERVHDYLKRNGSMTALDGVTYLGIIDLAGRIRDLRKLGVAVKSTPETVVNRFGEPCRIVRYSL